MEAGLFIFLALLGLIAVGMPIAFALAASATLTIYFYETTTFLFQAKSIVTAVNSYPLLAVPLFILAGDLMYTGGLSRRLTAAIYSLVGSIKASLSYVTVLAATFFGAISGSSPATVAAIGTVMIPEMDKQKYPSDYSAALIASSGMIGVMIPPSIPYVMYGVASEESVATLFMSGILPGFLFAAAYMLIARLIYGKRKLDTPLKPFKWEECRTTFKDAFWALLAPVIVLGGIYGGIVSPTEAAAVSVVYAVLVGGVFYKELTVKSFIETLSRSVGTIGMILALVAFASTFGRILTLEQVPQHAGELAASISSNPLVILLLINIALLVVGMFFETIAAIVILTPVLLPIAKSFGIDPIHFGTIMTINLAIGFCSPPFGVNLFVASAITKQSIEQISKALMPYFVAMIVLLLAITFIPDISLIIPRLLAGYGQ
jgi:C4-dicarboxylate transporter DctM subunit